MKEIRLSAWVLATLLTGAATSAQAAVPTTSAIEGVLMSSGGGPAADGNYTVSVSIYGAETGGSAVWTESGVTIAAKGGQFSYQIGSKTPLSAAALSLSTAWIGVQIGTDPELPRKPLGAAPFALRAAIAEGLECTGCLKAGNLDAGVLQPYAKAADLGAYAKTADLSAYAKASDLGAYAKTSDLSSYAKSADLGDYVKAASLAKVAGTGSYNDLKDQPTLAKVATSGSYADLTNKPVMAKIDSACGTNLVMKGIKADGSYECASAGIAADMINEVSNDLIWNQFVDKTDGTKDVQIKDGFSAGVTDTLAFPDIGVAQKIWVELNAGNSDVSKLTIELYGPGMTTPYILYKGSKTGTTLVAKYNDTDKIDTGDMDKDWLGKNIKGNWSITVKDTLAISVPPGTPPFVFDGKFNWSVNIQTLSSKKIQIKGDLIVDGATTATSGLKIGSPTTTCDASNVGMLRYTAGVNGLEACTVSPTLSAGNAYKWMVARPKPIIWSGGCTSHGTAGSWNTYCLNASDNNTASDYLSIDPGGTVTVKRAGWYRINWFGIANQANWAHVRIVKNGWDYIHYGHNHSFNTWQDQSVDMMWPFKEGEWFRVDINNSGGNGYAWHSYNLGTNYRGAHSSVQFEFVGPM